LKLARSNSKFWNIYLGLQIGLEFQVAQFSSILPPCLSHFVSKTVIPKKDEIGTSVISLKFSLHASNFLAMTVDV